MKSYIYIQDEEITISINLPYVKVARENLTRILKPRRQDLISILKTLCVNYFVKPKGQVTTQHHI